MIECFFVFFCIFLYFRNKFSQVIELQTWTLLFPVVIRWWWSTISILSLSDYKKKLISITQIIRKQSTISILSLSDLIRLSGNTRKQSTISISSLSDYKKNNQQSQYYLSDYKKTIKNHNFITRIRRKQSTISIPSLRSRD